MTSAEAKATMLRDLGRLQREQCRQPIPRAMTLRPATRETRCSRCGEPAAIDAGGTLLCEGCFNGDWMARP